LDVLQSRLFSDIKADADEYADLFDADVTRILDVREPLWTGHHRCDQHDSPHMSDEAQQAKQQHR